ncbi:hypothetical protein AB08_4588 [Escherichia coli 5-366-08_S1_C1]|nr:hypothetical protein AB67_5446 [Escherichia coli 5-366-08_S1_C3]KEL66264.1 hypothetical protein AB08_4588 [Escherichia coli 5-366-08_S1_C1]
MEGGILLLNMASLVIRRSPTPAGSAFCILWNSVRAYIYYNWM